MNDNFNDRLLDASLQEYSRVAPREDFAAQVLAQRVAPRPNWFAWLAVPAAAAALACSVLMMRPVPAAPAPLRLVAQPPVGQAFLPAALPRKIKGGRQECLPHCGFHTLTAVELASLTLPPEILAKPEEKLVTDIVISPLTVTPLEIPNIPDPEGVKQQ